MLEIPVPKIFRGRMAPGPSTGDHPWHSVSWNPISKILYLHQIGEQYFYFILFFVVVVFGTSWGEKLLPVETIPKQKMTDRWGEGKLHFEVWIQASSPISVHNISLNYLSHLFFYRIYLVVMMLVQVDPLEQFFNYLNTDPITWH